MLGAVTAPLLLLALVSLRSPGQHDDRGRRSLFLLILLSGWLLALLRLHVTGGYCTPRHALIFAFPVIAAAARGLMVLADTLAAGFSLAGLARYSLGLRTCEGLCLTIGPASERAQPERVIVPDHPPCPPFARGIAGVVACAATHLEGEVRAGGTAYATPRKARSGSGGGPPLSALASPWDCSSGR